MNFGAPASWAFAVGAAVEFPASVAPATARIAVAPNAKNIRLQDWRLMVSHFP
jgi:hypothetical protein